MWKWMTLFLLCLCARAPFAGAASEWSPFTAWYDIRVFLEDRIGFDAEVCKHRKKLAKPELPPHELLAEAEKLVRQKRFCPAATRFAELVTFHRGSEEARANSHRIVESLYQGRYYREAVEETWEFFMFSDHVFRNTMRSELSFRDELDQIAKESARYKQQRLEAHKQGLPSPEHLNPYRQYQRKLSDLAEQAAAFVNGERVFYLFFMSHANRMPRNEQFDPEFVQKTMKIADWFAKAMPRSQYLAEVREKSGKAREIMLARTIGTGDAYTAGAQGKSFADRAFRLDFHSFTAAEAQSQRRTAALHYLDATRWVDTESLAQVPPLFYRLTDALMLVRSEDFPACMTGTPLARRPDDSGFSVEQYMKFFAKVRSLKDSLGSEAAEDALSRRLAVVTQALAANEVCGGKKHLEYARALPSPRSMRELEILMRHYEIAYTHFLRIFAYEDFRQLPVSPEAHYWLAEVSASIYESKSLPETMRAPWKKRALHAAEILNTVYPDNEWTRKAGDRTRAFAEDAKPAVAGS